MGLANFCWFCQTVPSLNASADWIKQVHPFAGRFLRSNLSKIPGNKKEVNRGDFSRFPSIIPGNFFLNPRAASVFHDKTQTPGQKTPLIEVLLADYLAFFRTLFHPIPKPFTSSVLTGHGCLVCSSTPAKRHREQGKETCPSTIPTNVHCRGYGNGAA